MKNKLIKSQKGLASIFIVLYLVIVMCVFGACLLSLIQIKSAATTERLALETEREQEAIQIQKGSISYSGNLIDSITVNNIGSIPVRIRGIYVNSTMVFDPSTTQETCINPQENLMINVLPYASVAYAANEFITVTTERGTVFREMLYNLETNGSTIEINTVYGPIKLLFEEFHWTLFQNNFDLNYLNSATWYEGWNVDPSISGGHKAYIIWRIKIQNVGSENLQLTGNSSFGLVSNQGGVQYAYYMDIICSDMTIEPGDPPSAVYFAWKIPAPTDRRSNNAKPTPMESQAFSWMTFIVFEGKMGDKIIAETIPFEAVLVTET